MVGDSRVTVTFNANAIVALAGNSLTQIVTALRARLPAQDNVDADSESIILTVPVRLRLRGGIKRVEGWDQSNWVRANSRHDPALIKALAQAHEWRGWIEEGTAVTLEDVATRSNHDRKYSHKVLKLAFLAPDIQRAILTGRQHKSFTLAAVTETDGHQVRHIRLNGSHSARVTPSWYGDCIGHYEGDTLVVDTVGVKPGRFRDGRYFRHAVQRSSAPR